MLKVRVRYDKTGKLRFVSAIDLGRLWERALRRADLPIAYSEGFSPHPRISFPDALPLGYASTGEYAELAFAAPVHLGEAVAALNAAFPDGLRIRAAAETPDGAPKLAKCLRASCWDVSYDGVDGLENAVDAVRCAASLPVARERKGPATTIDLRPAIHLLGVAGGTVRAVLHHVEPPVRPSEVHLALMSFHPGLPPPALTTRVAQGSPAPEGLVEALSGDLVSPLPDQRTTRARERQQDRDPTRGVTPERHVS